MVAHDCAVSGPDPFPNVLHAPMGWSDHYTSRLCQPVFREDFLLLVDSHSKWIDVHITNAYVYHSSHSEEAKSYIFKLQKLCTNNGTSFVSSNFTCRICES